MRTWGERMLRSLPARSLEVGLRRYSAALGAAVLLTAGCTSFQDWVHNGFKVGPNFEEPPAATTSAWIDASDKRIASESPPGDDWWKVFQDPSIPILIETAHRENLDLKTAGTRILQAQAQRNIAAGNLFPQSQNASGDYFHAQLPSGLL